MLITGDTPLHLAAKNGCTDALKLLVDAKADVDVQDSKSGKTALHHAVENDDLPMVGYLVTEVSIYRCQGCTVRVNTHFLSQPIVFEVYMIVQGLV